jgi:plasmid maintenance system killer protein
MTHSRPSRRNVSADGESTCDTVSFEVLCIDGNWRLTFEFKDGNVNVLDYEDYH